MTFWHEPPHDQYGVPINVGSYVVYNMSGELVIGEVVGIIEKPHPARGQYPSAPNWRYTFKIKLDTRGMNRPQFAWKARKSGHVSTVRRAESIKVVCGNMLVTRLR